MNDQKYMQLAQDPESNREALGEMINEAIESCPWLTDQPDAPSVMWSRESYDQLACKYGVTWRAHDYVEDETPPRVTETVRDQMAMMREAAKDTRLPVTDRFLNDATFYYLGLGGLGVSGNTIQPERFLEARVLDAQIKQRETFRKKLILRERPSIQKKMREYQKERNFRVYDLKQAREAGLPIDNFELRINTAKTESDLSPMHPQHPHWQISTIAEILTAQPAESAMGIITKVEGVTDMGMGIRQFGDDPPPPEMWSGDHTKDSMFVLQSHDDRRDPFDLFEEAKAKLHCHFDEVAPPVDEGDILAQIRTSFVSDCIFDTSPVLRDEQGEIIPLSERFGADHLRGPFITPPNIESEVDFG